MSDRNFLGWGRKIRTPPPLKQIVIILGVTSQILLFFLTSESSGAASPPAVNFDKIQKLYYLLASPRGVGRSSFGHAYLRLGEDTTPSPKDLVIEFVADVSDRDLNYLRAIGVGPNYGRKVTLDSYQRVQQVMNFYQDRTLTSYEILLNSEQREIALKSLEKIVRAGSFGTYSFLSENCAAGVSQILKQAFTETGSATEIYSIRPNRIAESLREQNLVGSVTVDLSLTERHEKVFSKYKSFLAPILNRFPFLENDLASAALVNRVLAYTLVRKNESLLSETARGQAQKFLMAKMWLEPRLIRKELSAEINSGTGFAISAERSGELEWSHPNYIAEQTRFHVIDQHLAVEITLSTEKPAPPKTRPTEPLRIEFPDTRINGSEIFWNEVKIGFLRSDNGQVILTQGHLVLHLQKELPYARSLSWDARLLIEREAQNRVLGAAQWIRQKMPLLNNYPKLPACYGLVEIQKDLLERVIWDPQGAKLNAKDNLDLLRQLSEGQIIVVPGYDQVSAWMHDMDEMSVRRFIHGLHRTKYASLWQSLRLFFERSKVDENVLRGLADLAREGIYTPLHFRLKNSNTGHAILFFGVQDRGRELWITAYDPNFGIVNDFFKFDTTTQSMNAATYGQKISLYHVPEDVEGSADYLKITQGALRTMLIEMSRRTGSHAFSLSDVVQGM